MFKTKFILIILFSLLCNSAFASQISGGGSGSSSSSSFVSNRQPTGTDDVAHGFATNQIWNYGGNFWISQNVAATTANWEYQTKLISAPACDLVTTCLGAYGVFRLKAAYAGNAFEITRASDSTKLAVPFDVNGVASWSQVDIFCFSTTCTVDTWYDQSGNGYDLTQGVVANQPKILGGYVGNLRSITFDGYNAQKTLGNTSMPITNRQNFTALFVGSTVGAGGSSTGDTLFQIGNPTNSVTIFSGPEVSPNFGFNAGSPQTFSVGLVAHSPASYLIVDTAGTITAQQNNQVNTGGAGVGSAAATGVFLGSTSLIGYPLSGEVISFIIYNSALSSANQNILLEDIDQFVGLKPQVNDRIVFIGDSITCCNSLTGTLPDNSYETQLLHLLPRPFTGFQFGQSGELLSTMVSHAATIAPLAYLSGATNIVTIFGGTNDLSANATAAAVYANMQTICGTYKATGYKCVVVSPLPRDASFSGGATSASVEVQRLALIALLQASHSFADGFIDLGSDPVIGAGIAAADNTALYIDKIHPTAPLGTSYIASAFARGLSSLTQ